VTALLLNDFFDRIFVISLARAAERRAQLSSNLPGLNWEYWDAFDGRLLSPEVLGSDCDESGMRQTHGRLLVANEVACALSHRAIYDVIIERGYERVLILEDDVRLLPDGPPMFEMAAPQLPADWDLLLLCTYRDEETRLLYLKMALVYPILNALNIRRYDLDKVRNQYSRSFSTNLRIAGQHWGSWSYAVSRKGAATLRQLTTPIRGASDSTLRELCLSDGARCFLTVPNVFEHREDAGSSIWDIKGG
jgi:glycosyl transferase, family 25